MGGVGERGEGCKTLLDIPYEKEGRDKSEAK